MLSGMRAEFIRKALLGLCVLGLSGCSPFLCQKEIFARLLSPDGINEAVVFTVDCGGASRFNVQISVVKKGEDPGDGGNAFVVHGRYRSPKVLDGEISALWMGRALRVEFPPETEIFVKEPEVNGTKIEYVTVTGDEQRLMSLP